MKKYLLLMALLAALLLTGCSQKPQEKTEPKPSTQIAEQKPDTPAADRNAEQKPEAPVENQTTQTAAPARPEKQELEFLLEGQEESVPAALYSGKGYSLYIPAEGWRLDDRDREDGVLETVWESTLNDDVELRVLSFGNRTRQQAYDWLKAEEDDFALQEDKQGGLWGSDREDREQMEVRFHEADGQLFAVLWVYPEEAAEGFGVRLSVLADTFQITT